MSRIELLILGGFLWSAKRHGIDERAVFGLRYNVVFDEVMIGVVHVKIMILGNSPDGRIELYKHSICFALQWPRQIAENELFFAPDRLIRQLSFGAYIPPEKSGLWTEALPLLNGLIQEEMTYE